jgi:hypothetical protein
MKGVLRGLRWRWGSGEWGERRGRWLRFVKKGWGGEARSADFAPGDGFLGWGGGFDW